MRKSLIIATDQSTSKKHLGVNIYDQRGVCGYDNGGQRSQVLHERKMRENLNQIKQIHQKNVHLYKSLSRARPSKDIPEMSSLGESIR